MLNTLLFPITFPSWLQRSEITKDSTMSSELDELFKKEVRDDIKDLTKSVNALTLALATDKSYVKGRVTGVKEGVKIGTWGVISIIAGVIGIIWMTLTGKIDVIDFFK